MTMSPAVAFGRSRLDVTYVDGSHHAADAENW
jgi:hypothetical protein